MRLVLDCNVVVSAAWNDGLPRRVLRHAVASETILVSPAILAEYVRVSGYPKLVAKRAFLVRLIGELARVATLVEDTHVSLALPDPKDMAYVAAAHAGEADVIVTGNLKHFPAREYGPARVLSVREFAELAGLVPSTHSTG